MFLQLFSAQVLISRDREDALLAMQAQFQLKKLPERQAVQLALGDVIG